MEVLHHTGHSDWFRGGHLTTLEPVRIGHVIFFFLLMLERKKVAKEVPGVILAPRGENLTENDAARGKQSQKMERCSGWVFESLDPTMPETRGKPLYSPSSLKPKDSQMFLNL